MKQIFLLLSIISEYMVTVCIGSVQVQRAILLKLNQKGNKL